jgi:hypothetical protein
MAYRGAMDGSGSIRLHVSVRPAEGRREFRTNALVDTGAYWCGINADVVKDLELVPRGLTDRDTPSGIRQAPFYIVEVHVEDVFDGLLNAALNHSVNHRFILGRQFLSSLKLVANWKEHTFTIGPA